MIPFPHRMVIVSNTSSRASFTVERLKRFGFNPDMFIGGITSGEEALKHMKTLVSAGSDCIFCAGIFE